MRIPQCPQFEWLLVVVGGRWLPPPLPATHPPHPLELPEAPLSYFSWQLCLLWSLHSCLPSLVGMFPNPGDYMMAEGIEIRTIRFIPEAVYHQYITVYNGILPTNCPCYSMLLETQFKMLLSHTPMVIKTLKIWLKGCLSNTS